MLFQNIPKKNMRFPLEQEKKIWPRRRLAQLFISTSALGILYVETQLNSLKIKWIQRLVSPTNALWKNLMLYQLNLILNHNQGLAFFRQNRSLGLLVTNTYKNRTIKISLFSYSMLSYILQITTSLPPRLQNKFLINPYF